MTSLDVDTVKQLALGDLEYELALTRRMLERLPDDRMGWKPHPKSATLGELATHIAHFPVGMALAIQEDDVEVTALPADEEPTISREALLRQFDERVAELKTAFAQMSGDELLRDWTFRQGAHVLMQRRKGSVLRTLGLSHMVHHRGQMSVYLRLLDVPVPQTYGPTADEPTT